MNSREDIIVHQGNCVTNRSNGLAASIFSWFPHANVYEHRAGPSQPDTFIVRGDNKNNNRRIACLFARYYPGHAKYSDSQKQRLDWFRDSPRSLCDWMTEDNGHAMADFVWHGGRQLETL